jgi:hypothetical protein
VKIAVDLAAGAAPQPGAPFAGAPEIAVLALGAPTTARVWRAGMPAARELRGASTLVRTRHAACEHELSAQRIELHVLGERGSSLLVHERLASGAVRAWFGWRDGSGALRSLRPEVSLEEWRAEGDGPPIPHRIRARGEALRGAAEVGAVRISIDPLDALPRVVRMLYWFNVHPRRIWADTASDLAPAGSEPPPRGASIATFTFLRPPEVTLSAPPAGG